MFDWIKVIFGWIMRWCYNFVEMIGFGGYALALLLFSLICQLILFGFGIKQQKNSQKQALLRPKENVIRRRYKGRNDRNSQMKMNEEIQALYQEEHYSPFSGCLPLIIQLPIIFSLFYVIREPLTYITGLGENLILEINNFLANAGIEGFKVLDSLKGVSEISILNNLNADTAGVFTHFASQLEGLTFPDFQLGPIDLSLTPNAFFSGASSWYIIIIPVATFLSSYFGQKLTRKFTYQAPSAESQSSLTLMNVIMPLFSAYLAFIWEASMGLYWTFRSILSLLQQIALSKMFPVHKFTDAELAAEEKAYLAKLRGKGVNNKPVTTDIPGRKSLIFDDDDEDDGYVPENEHSIVDDDEK